MAKKSCDKHETYVYKCRDCRIANGEEKPDSDSKGSKKKEPQKKEEETPTQRRYLDADLEHLEDEEYDIPVKKVSERKRYISPPSPPSRPKRYKYKKPISHRRKITIIGLSIFSVIIVVIIILYAIPSWYAGISLQRQLYANKAGLPFWEYLVLNYWSSSFILNKVGLIGGIVGSLVMSIPPERNLLTAIGNRFGWGKLSRKKALLFWWTIGFVFFYFIGQAIDGFSNFALAMYMANHGDVSLSPNVMNMIFNVFTNNINVNMMQDVFIYTNVYLPIISYILVIFLIRVLLNIIKEAYLVRNDYGIVANLMFMISIFFTMYFFSIPTHSYDRLGLILLWSTPIGLLSFLILGIYFTIKKNQKITLRLPGRSQRKKLIAAFAIIIFLIIIPAFASIPVAVSINNNYNSWYTNRWQVQTSKNIDWTRNAAGLSMFSQNDITNLTNSNPSNLVKEIRQFDRQAATFQMTNYAQSPFETLANPEIVYVNGKEYWVAPKTLKVSHFAGDPIKQNTNMFDHVEGFLALYTNNGTLILNNSQFESIFGVSNNYPFFFGEHEALSIQTAQANSNASFTSLFSSTGGYGAYDSDILLNTPGTTSNETQYLHLYSGQPDGTLSGLEAFWFTAEMGFFSYAINSSMEKQYLINRNVMTRVSQILLPGLWLDDNPYLVFDFAQHKLFYAVSICVDIPLGGYSSSDIMRYLGVALVDEENGNLTFVENPALAGVNAQNDPTYNMWKMYLSAYPWQSINDPQFSSWLPLQLRYPEQLFEKQLDYEYKYHVSDPQTWYGSADFYAMPPDGDLYYIIFDLGQGPEFVAIDTVQKAGVSSITLAGLYVLRQGNNFGKCIFYAAPSVGAQKMIGPQTALSSFQTVATQQLTLITNKVIGNVLLYPMAGSLYYFIPVYSEQGTYQSLVKAGFVNAFDAQDVTYSNTADSAYLLLNYTESKSYEQGNVNVTYLIQDSPDLKSKIMNIYAFYDNLNLTASPVHLILNISIQSDLINVSKFGVPVPSSNFTWGSGSIGENYTIMDIPALYPSEGYSIGLQLSSEVPNVYSITVQFKLVLSVDGVVSEIPQSTWDKVTILG